MASTDPSRHIMEVETSDHQTSTAESGSNNNNISATDTVNTRNATGTLDEDTSSIEALNWCEFDEEEMASAKAPTDSHLKKENEMDSEETERTGPALQHPGVHPALSTSLLQSIDSQMSEDDKVTKIENWASDVISATEDDLMGGVDKVIGGDVSTSTSSTTVYQQVHDSDDGIIDNYNKSTRKRGNKSNVMAMSTISSLSNADSKGDVLSNAPVLDEGPIWGKGSKRYKFQENRRFNQKLTFGVLLSVVLAIGLGLGNLVAYNECEAEYKSTASSVTPAPSTAQRPPIPTSDDADSEKLHDSNPTNPKVKGHEEQHPIEDNLKDSPAEIHNEPEETTTDNSPVTPTTHVLDEKKDPVPPLLASKDQPEFIVDEKPFVDPSYATHAEALASVVKSLDQLSRKIDQFQNTTRQLGGIVMLKEDVIKEMRSKTDAKDKNFVDEIVEAPLEEEVHPDLSDEELALGSYDEDEETVIEDFINAIKETDEHFGTQFYKDKQEEIGDLREASEVEVEYNNAYDSQSKYDKITELAKNIIEEMKKKDTVKAKHTRGISENKIEFDELVTDNKEEKNSDYRQEKAEYRDEREFSHGKNEMDLETVADEKNLDGPSDQGTVNHKQDSVVQKVSWKTYDDEQSGKKEYKKHRLNNKYNNEYEKENETKEKMGRKKKNYKNQYKQSEKWSVEEMDSGISGDEMELVDTNENNRKWDEMDVREKRKQYSNKKDKNSHKGKVEKVEKQNNGRYNEIYEEAKKWKEDDVDWTADRAKFREQQRQGKDNSINNLGKKNKNWQLDRDRAREKFRNKGVPHEY